MSFPEQQQQQPGLVYPNTAISPSHSKGSFGAVFIVLAVIVVVSALACFLSRLCNRSHHRQSHHQEPPRPRPEKREPKQEHHGNFDDKEMGDIEFGFGKAFPNGKQFGNKGTAKGAKVKPNVSFENEEMAKGAKVKPNVRFEFSGDPRVAGERGA